MKLEPFILLLNEIWNPFIEFCRRHLSWNDLNNCIVSLSEYFFKFLWPEYYLNLIRCLFLRYKQWLREIDCHFCSEFFIFRYEFFKLPTYILWDYILCNFFFLNSLICRYKFKRYIAILKIFWSNIMKL